MVTRKCSDVSLHLVVIPPDNLVREPIASKDVVENEFDVMTYMPIEVYKNRAAVTQQFSHEHETRCDHCEIR